MPEVTVNKKSSPKEIQNWISNCIRTRRREGTEPDQAAAICYSQARKATGKRLGK